MKPIKLIFILTASILLNFKMHAQTLSLTASDYNGFNVSCFGKSDGAIDLTIVGGTPPYFISWSSDRITEDITDLPAGYYRVEVDDSDSLTEPVSVEITLTEPRKIDAEVLIHTYNDKYNISAFDACNGMISFQALGGVAPYQYMWNDNNTTNNRTNLCAEKYLFVIQDANQCRFRSEYIILVQPDRNDWQMGGNQNTDPVSHFIGTLDSIDFVFRTNGLERLRLGANGIINFGNNLNVGNTLIFSNNRVIEYKALDATGPEVMSFGSRINLTPFTISCVTPLPTSIFQFNGLLQSWGTNTTGNTNMMEFGFDGNNSVIDAAGSNSGTNDHRLLINYNCGKDVFIGNPTLGGNLTANRDFFAFGNTGLGTTDLQGYRLNVNGDINFSGNLFRNNVNIIGGLWNVNNTGIDYTSGNVGIGPGAVDPTSKLEVAGEVLLLSHHNDKNNAIEIRSDNLKPERRGISIGRDLGTQTQKDGSFNFWIHRWQDEPSIASFNFKENVDNKTLMSINADGQVAINSEPASGFKLTVKGDIKCTRVKVVVTWADFVFNDDYLLKPLAEVEKFIKTNNHLPDVPSASEIETKGLDLGELVKIQMQKIEEHTLYILQLNKQIIELQTKLELLTK